MTTTQTRVATVATYVLWRARAARVTHPEGHFDGGGRWYPSDRENPEGFTAGLRGPSRAWPSSYLAGARTRKHAAALVEAALGGSPVPADVASAVEVARKLVEAAVAAETVTVPITVPVKGRAVRAKVAA